MEKTHAEESKKFYIKLNNVINDIEKIQEKKNGYNFEYVTLETILKNVDTAAITHNMMVVTAPEWYINNITGSVDKEMIQIGKEFAVWGTVIYRIVDLETGFVKEYHKLASGKGTDPGQAVGSAESYSLRQFLNKTFKVEIEKEVDVSQSVYVFDRDDNSSIVLSTKEINDIASILVSKTGDSEQVKNYVGTLLSKYNKHFKTNYGKLGEFPKSELKDITEYAKAMNKETLSLAQA